MGTDTEEEEKLAVISGRDKPPRGLRGKIHFDQRLCAGCRTCEHVCASSAIRIVEARDGSGLNFILWHNTCVFCGLCEHYCPTKAIHLTEDYHTTHLQEDKYNFLERGFIHYVPCACCGKLMVPVSRELLALAYGDAEEVEHLARLCEKCRPGRTLRKG